MAFANLIPPSSIMLESIVGAVVLGLSEVFEDDVVSASWWSAKFFQARAQMSGNGEERSISRSNLNYL